MIASFIETKLFSRIVGDYLDESEYLEVQRAICREPTRGDVIRGSGGVRKLRWPAKGRGKRGGVRVLYYLRLDDGVIWMLTIYAKNEAQSIPLHTLRSIREAIDG
jgi:hypothetical protein